MDEKTEDAFRDWEVSIRKNESSELDGALNQTTERVDNKKGALNQKLNETEQQTKELVDHARSLMDTGSNEFVTRELNQIQSDPTVSPIAQDLIKQWSTIEDIQSGRLNSTIEAYIISNNKESLTPKDPQKAKEFSEVVSRMRENIWVKPTTDNIDAFAASKVLGTDRERIVSNMHQIGASGKYDRMTWDSESRSVIFHGESGIRILDTASIPPRERIMRNGLSISREISPIVADPARERNESKRNVVAQIVPTIPRDTKEMLSDKMEDGSDIVSPEIWGMLDNTLSHISLRNSQSAKLSRTMIETTWGVLRMEQGRLNILSQDKSKINPLDPDIWAIKWTITRINTIMESLQKIQEKTTIEEENAQSNRVLWDTNARDNLSWLTTNYFDRMWPASQQAIDRIIALVNSDRTLSNQIQLWEPLSSMSKEILERSLTKLWGTTDVLTSGDKLPTFQKRITESLNYPPSDKRSIEWQLQQPDTAKPDIK